MRARQYVGLAARLLAPSRLIQQTSNTRADAGPLKPAEWIGTALRDLRALPDEPRRTFGYAIHLAQLGRHHLAAKRLIGAFAVTRGIATPKHDVAVIRERWQRAKAHYAAHHQNREE